MKTYICIHNWFKKNSFSKFPCCQFHKSHLCAVHSQTLCTAAGHSVHLFRLSVSTFSTDRRKWAAALFRFRLGQWQYILIVVYFF